MMQNVVNQIFLLLLLIFLFYLMYLIIFHLQFEKTENANPKKLVKIEDVLRANSNEGLLIYTDLDELAMSCEDYNKALSEFENNMSSRSSIPIFKDRVKKSIKPCNKEVRSVLPRFKIIAHDL